MTDRHTAPESRQRLPRLQRLAGYVLGVATGLGVNALSTDGVGYRGAAILAAVAAILVSINWLRQLPSQAPLIQIVSWGLLGGAAITAVVAAANPGWEGPATIAAIALTIAAILISTDLEKAAELLFRVALIGIGVTAIGLGVADLRSGDLLNGVPYIGSGIGAIGLGLAFLHSSAATFRGASTGGLANLHNGVHMPVGVTLLGIGLGNIGLGVANLRSNDLLDAVHYIGSGIGTIGLGLAFLRSRDVLVGIALISIGLGSIGGGVASLISGHVLFGVALIGSGVAFIGVSAGALRRTGIFVPALTWFASLARAPSSEVLHQAAPTVCEPEDRPSDTRAPMNPPGHAGRFTTPEPPQVA